MSPHAMDFLRVCVEVQAMTFNWTIHRSFRSRATECDIVPAESSTLAQVQAMLMGLIRSRCNCNRVVDCPSTIG